MLHWCSGTLTLSGCMVAIGSLSISCDAFLYSFTFSLCGLDCVVYCLWILMIFPSVLCPASCPCGYCFSCCEVISPGYCFAIDILYFE